MELSHEYNEYVIGYVVTDEETGRSCNFQFDHDRNISYNPVGRRHFLTFACEGDDTHSAFTESELNEMSIYLDAQNDAKQAEKIITAAHETDELHEAFGELCAESSNGVCLSDVEEMLRKS